MRGRGWGKRSKWLRYIYDHPFVHLVSYHRLVLQEMIAKGYKPDLRWMEPEYRGRFAQPIPEDLSSWDGESRMYPEHSIEYFNRCVVLLRGAVLRSKRRISDEDILRMERAIDAEVLVLSEKSK